MIKSMKRGRWRILKVIFYNLLVLLLLINVVYWIIPIVGAIEQFARYTGLSQWNRKPPAVYAASDIDWLRKNWLESERSRAIYKSYVGWRSQPIEGQTINIGGRYLQRRTVSPQTPGSPKAYFFGGSTMWGGDVDDARTIPSYFAAQTGMHAENFGERAWVAHQSLMMLIQLLQEGHRPDLVVFYDGVNDVLQKCRTGIGPEAHGREQQFAANIGRGVRPYYFAHYWAPFAELAHNVKLGLTGIDGWYDCADDPEKAPAVTQALLQDWAFARQLTEWHGGNFIGILQPVVYYSGARASATLPAINTSTSDEHQYRAIYPRLREAIAKDGVYHDFVTVLDAHQHVYLDWAHVSAEGNRHIAGEISRIVGTLPPKRVKARVRPQHRPAFSTPAQQVTLEPAAEGEDRQHHHHDQQHDSEHEG